MRVAAATAFRILNLWRPGLSCPRTRRWYGQQLDDRRENWSGGITSVVNSGLPSRCLMQSAVNNFPAGMTFNSIEIDGSGYTLSGNAINLAHGITTTYSSGASTDVMNTQLGGTISV